MRVALLSIVKTSDCGSGGYRGFIEFAGRSVARRQLDLALALGCERVVVVTDYLHQPLLALQHACEAAGARFNTVSSARALSGLIKASDELLVLADSLLPMSDAARERLEKGPCVLTLPCEEGIAAGFERIDLNNAWAGALLMPGSGVEKLIDLPADCDVAASLLRIALQARVREVALSASVLADGDWSLLTSPTQAETLEAVWLRRHVPADASAAPGHAIATWLLTTFAVPLARRSRAGVQLRLLSILLLLFGIGVGLWVWLPLGFLLIGFSYLSQWVANGVGAVEAATGSTDRGISSRAAIAGWLLDLVLAGMVAAGTANPPSGWPVVAFSALILPLSLRVLAGVAPLKWAGLAQDRFLAAIFLAAAAFGGALDYALALLCLASLGASLYFMGRSPQKTEITRP